MRCRSALIRRITGLVCLIILLSSCTSINPPVGEGIGTPAAASIPTLAPTTTPVPTLSIPSRFYQAPSLDVLVQAGVLPAINYRLPQKPMIVLPVNEMGRYSGTWHMVIRPFIDQAQFIRTVAYEPLVRWKTDWSGIEPNIAESYSVNEDATEYTFHLRRSMRWSDGIPFTTRDIRFWYEDVLLDPELTPEIPSWLKVAGEVARFEFIDEATFIVRFSSPNSLFLQHLASPDGLRVTAFQALYAEKYHAKYIQEEELQKLVQDGGYSSWAEMFVRKIGVAPLDNGNFADPKRPRLSAWILSDPYVPGAKFVNWERNPYYWKVDPEGKQLPYLDSVRFDIVESVDDIINRAAEGAIDMQNLSTLGLDTAILNENNENQVYDLYTLQDGYSNAMMISLNLTHPNAAMRDIFRNKDFRVALSYAIDRQEIVRQIYYGEGKPWQAAPLEGSPFYDANMAVQYTEYSVEKANEYLDRAGLGKDPLGQRLNSQGLPISFSVMVLETETQQVAMLNLVARYLDAVGIDIQPLVEPLPIFKATIQSNLHDAVASRAGGTIFEDVLVNPTSYIPVNDDAFWAANWAGWYNKIAGHENDTPEPSVISAMQLYDGVRAANNPVEQVRLMKEVLAASRENFWTIGIAQAPQQYGIAKKNFHNVPERMPSAWIYPDPAPANPEQFYLGN